MSVLALTVREPPSGTKHKIGDTIRFETIAGQPKDFKIYGIKAGGFGIAYVVLDEETLKPYCLKTFRHRSTDTTTATKQLKREAEVWIRLGKHPNLIFVHSVLESGGHPYILFDYAARSDVGALIKNGPLPVRLAIAYAIQFCRGMSYAQDQLPGFVHGDIKPSNCLLTHDGTLKIADFGQADGWDGAEELTKAPALDKTDDSPQSSLKSQIKKWRIGTPPYMAPEQFDLRNRIDVRTDVYAFGIMLFHMLTGRRPFKGRTHRECFEEHTNAIPPDPAALISGIPEPLARLVQSCLAKSPAQRPENFASLDQELSSILSTHFGQTIPPVRGERLAREEFINRGLSLIALGYYDEAVGHFDSLLASEPNSARLWSYKGEALLASGRHGSAGECYDRALQLDSGLASVWARKGETLTELGNDRDAISCFDNALKLDSRLALAWKRKGQTLSRLGEHENAVRCLKRALSLDSLDAQSVVALGTALSSLGREQEAIALYERAAKLNSRCAEAHYALGKSLLRIGQTEPAIESLREALRLKPEHGEAHAQLGVAQRQLYSTSSRFVSEDFAREVASFLLGRMPDASDSMDQIIDFLERSNFDPKIFYLCAEALYENLNEVVTSQKELLTRTLGEIRKATNASEHGRAYFYRLGKIYYGLDSFDDCLEVFQESIRLFGPDYKACYYVAACKEMQNEYQTALKLYQQALSLESDCPPAQDGMRRMKARLAPALVVKQ